MDLAMIIDPYTGIAGYFTELNAHLGYFDCMIVDVI